MPDITETEKTNYTLTMPVDMKAWLQQRAAKSGQTIAGYLKMLVDRERQAETQRKHLEAQVRTYMHEHDIQEVER